MMNKEHVELNGKTILVTGSPGFIGANLVLRLLAELSSGTVISFDNLNDYYDPALKEYRLGLIEKTAETSPVKHVFIRGSIGDKALVDKVFAEYRPAVIVNLAAQAGVRYSIDHPDVYIESNIVGFYNILEACRHNPVEHLVYASSSSVYGGNKKERRVAGAQLLEALQHPFNGSSVFHGLRPCRATGYVLLFRNGKAGRGENNSDF